MKGHNIMITKRIELFFLNDENLKNIIGVIYTDKINGFYIKGDGVFLDCEGIYQGTRIKTGSKLFHEFIQGFDKFLNDNEENVMCIEILMKTSGIF